MFDWLRAVNTSIKIMLVDLSYLPQGIASGAHCLRQLQNRRASGFCGSHFTHCILTLNLTKLTTVFLEKGDLAE